MEIFKRDPEVIARKDALKEIKTEVGKLKLTGMEKDGADMTILELERISPKSALWKGGNVPGVMETLLHELVLEKDIGTNNPAYEGMMKVLKITEKVAAEKAKTSEK